MIVPSDELMPVVRASLGRGQRVRMTVSGSSMWPFLRNGDVVELEGVERVRLGDIVLVGMAPGRPQRYVLHRAVRMEGDAFFVRGDAQTGCEGPFRAASVLGRATTVWRQGRVRCLDRGLWRIAGRLWLGLHPLGMGLFPLLRFVARMRARAVESATRGQGAEERGEGEMGGQGEREMGGQGERKMATGRRHG